jgi:hypothetical protein
MVLIYGETTWPAYFQMRMVLIYGETTWPAYFQMRMVLIWPGIVPGVTL